MKKNFNLHEFETSEGVRKKQLINELDNICQDTGFLLVTGHGIDKNIIQNTWSVIDNFFDQSINFKDKVKSPFKGYPYGYLSYGLEALAQSKSEDTPPDLKESFNIGPQSTPDSITQQEAMDFCYVPSLWPDIPHFKTYSVEYYNAMQNLASRIMRAFALALKLKHTFFDPYINEPISALRMLNYPAIQNKVLPKQQMAGAHTDYGSLTILLTKDKTKGLQIKNNQGKWVDVPYNPEAFIINIGDLMAQWTNDKWVSTLHRVVPNSNNLSRRSIAFFHQPNWNAEIKCLDSCKGKKIKYKPVKSGPYLMSKFKSTLS